VLSFSGTGTTSSSIPALQQEPLSNLGLGQHLLQAEHFPGGNQRRQLRECATGGSQLVRVLVMRLLQRGTPMPRVRRPGLGDH
jgi:hypothetical protein